MLKPSLNTRTIVGVYNLSEQSLLIIRNTVYTATCTLVAAGDVLCVGRFEVSFIIAELQQNVLFSCH